MTLLVVDDEWYAVKGISEGIDWRGTEIDEVLEAFSAAEAMRILQERRVDVLLCDIEMPEMSGLELSRWCASHTPGIKILFLISLVPFCLVVITKVCTVWHWEVLPPGVDGKRVRTGESFPPIVLQQFSLNRMDWVLLGTSI